MLTEWSVFVTAHLDKSLQVEPVFLVAKGNADSNFYLLECDPITGVLLTSGGGGGGGTGDVVGPAFAVDNQVTLFNGATGKSVKAATQSGIAKLTSGVLSAGLINLTSEVTGVLSITNGGTNSSTALSSGKAIISISGAIVESATTSTEITYLSGLTSSAQTQLNAKALAVRNIGTIAPLLGGGDLSADRTLSISKSTSAVDGYLAATDFTAFSAKQPAGSYVTSLSGDVTGAGPGVAATTIAAGVVTDAKIAAAAGIAVSKLAAQTVSRALVSDASGFISPASTTATEVGFLSGVSSSVQMQFAGKAPTVRNIQTAAPLAGGGDLSADRTITIPAATTLVDGYLSATDFTSFAAKVSTTRAINTTSPLTGGGDLSANRTLSMPAATGSQNGYLASADFTTFNAKQPAGSYITALAGDVVATGPGSVTATIQPGSITNAKIVASAGISVSKLAALTVSAPVRSDISGFITTGNLNAATELTGVVPVANGGTNSSASLSSNRVVVSSAGSLVEHSAITANRALTSNASGLPVASAVTDSELGFISGVTSSVQTQLTGKVAKAGDTMTGFLTLNADPSAALHATTKQYVDNIASGLDAKPSVKTATTANITLSAEQTLDGVLTSASRVLVKNQTTTADNGIYVSAAGAWTRASDMDAWLEVPSAFVFVEEGTLYSDTGWVCTSNAGGTIGTTPITFTQFSGAGTITTDGQGLSITGTQLSLSLDSTTLAKSGTGLKVATAGVTNNEVATGISRAKLAAGLVNRLTYNDGTTGLLIDLPAITASRALASDVNGLPAASATTSTELSYVAGTTSAIQTQLNAKQAAGAYVTALSGDVVATGPGAVTATIQTGAVTNAKIAAAAGISVNKLAALSVSSPVRSDASGFLTTGAVNAATELSGVVPVANGGTNSSTALTNNRFIVSVGGALVEQVAVTANKALASNASGLPVASATTDSELGFIAGVTSSVQTQINGKQISGTYVTALTGDVVATGPGSVAALIQAGAVTNAKIAAAAGISLNKLAAVTSNRAVVSDVSGFLTQSTTTDTEIGFISGLTSSAQTQINARLCAVSVTIVASNVTLTNKSIHLVDTSAARSLTLPAPAVNSYIVVKDKTGTGFTNNITIVRAGAEKIEGQSASYLLEGDFSQAVFVSDGTDWYDIS